MEKEKTISETCPRALPVVLFKGKQYYADLRVKEFRSVRLKMPSDWIRFDSEKGRVMCKNTGVVTCKSCGMSVIIPGSYEDKELRCMHCFSRELMPL
jgi:hypothetical protein